MCDKEEDMTFRQVTILVTSFILFTVGGLFLGGYLGGVDAARPMPTDLLWHCVGIWVGGPIGLFVGYGLAYRYGGRK